MKFITLSLTVLLSSCFGASTREEIKSKPLVNVQVYKGKLKSPFDPCELEYFMNIKNNTNANLYVKTVKCQYLYLLEFHYFLTDVHKWITDIPEYPPPMHILKIKPRDSINVGIMDDLSMKMSDSIRCSFMTYSDSLHQNEYKEIFFKSYKNQNKNSFTTEVHM